MKDEQDAPAENSGENTEDRCPENLRPYQWQKGQPSPNPGGRPKKAPISEAYTRHVGMPLLGDIRSKLGLPQGATWADAMALGQLRSAVKGNTAAAKEIADRVEGRVPLPKEKPDEEDLRFEIVHIVGRKELTDGWQDEQTNSQDSALGEPEPR